MNLRPRSGGAPFQVSKRRPIWREQRALRDVLRERGSGQQKRHHRRIVRLCPSRGLQWRARTRRWCGSDDTAVVSENLLKILQRNAAISEQARRPTSIECNHTRLQADLRCIADKNRINAPIELLQHMVSGGR